MGYVSEADDELGFVWVVAMVNVCENVEVFDALVDDAWALGCDEVVVASVSVLVPGLQ